MAEKRWISVANPNKELQDKLSKELLLEAVEALHIEPSSLVRVIKGNSAAVEIVKILEGLVG